MFRALFSFAMLLTILPGCTGARSGHDRCCADRCSPRTKMADENYKKRSIYTGSRVLVTADRRTPAGTNERFQTGSTDFMRLEVTYVRSSTSPTSRPSKFGYFTAVMGPDTTVTTDDDGLNLVSGSLYVNGVYPWISTSRGYAGADGSGFIARTTGTLANQTVTVFLVDHDFWVQSGSNGAHTLTDAMHYMEFGPGDSDWNIRNEAGTLGDMGALKIAAEQHL